MEKLEILISELEAEKATLLRLIDEDVKAQDFLNAHFRSLALEQINRRLHTLRNLDDELYDKKQLLEMGIQNLRERLKNETDENVRSVIERLINANEKELSMLSLTPKRKENARDQVYLRQSIDQFLHRRIQGLRVILNKADNLSIEIGRSKDGVKLSISNIKILRPEYAESDERFLKLSGLGFALNRRGDKAITTLVETSNDITDTIMRLISIIVFEVFYFKELHGTAIQIIDRRMERSQNNS